MSAGRWRAPAERDKVGQDPSSSAADSASASSSAAIRLALRSGCSLCAPRRGGTPVNVGPPRSVRLSCPAESRRGLDRRWLRAFQRSPPLVAGGVRKITRRCMNDHTCPWRKGGAATRCRRRSPPATRFENDTHAVSIRPGERIGRCPGSLCVSVASAPSDAREVWALSLAVTDEELAALVQRITEAAQALISGDIEGYAARIRHGHDYTLMSPYGGDPVRGFDDSDRALDALAQFFRGGEAEVEVVDTYTSGDLAACRHRTTARDDWGSTGAGLGRCV